MKKLSLLLTVAGAIVVFSIQSAGAVGYGGVGGKPAHPNPSNPRTQSIFIYQLKPGQSTNDGVEVYNNTTSQQTVTVEAVDSVLASGGAFSCAQAADPKVDVGSWISLSGASITLPANGSQVVPFTLNVPSKAAVGEHDGCITIQDSSMTQATSTAGVVLSFRSAIRVVVTIPGKIIKKLTLNAVNLSKGQNGNYIVSPKAQNEGNVSLDAGVSVHLASIFGTTTSTQTASYPVLPRSTASWNFSFKHPFWGGWYHAYTAATYNSNPTAELGINQGSSQTVRLTSAIFFAAPTEGGAFIELLIILVLVVIVWLYVRKQRDISKIRGQWRSYSVNDGDTVVGLAKDRNTTWKKIVRANKLKPPYTLRKGQNLRLPHKRKD